MTTLPISIRDVPPHPKAKRLNGTRPDGLPDGVHTGGAWLWEDRVYKPLDARPYVNADCHVRTNEVEFLEEMSDVDLFPKNWILEEHNGRQFLVRDEAITPKTEHDYHQYVSVELAFKVEQAIREANRRHWELGDAISLAYAKGEWFILDCSNAFRRSENLPSHFRANEEYRILKFFRLCGYDVLAERRDRGHHAVSSLEFLQKKEDLSKADVAFQYVYGSYSRPFSLVWARLPNDVAVMILSQERNDQIPYSWIITNKPLQKSILDRYELTWCWSPIHKWEM